MSRIGKKEIVIPAGVTVDIDEKNFVKVKGSKGELSAQLSSEIVITNENGTLKLSRPNDTKRLAQLHGTTRSLLFNMIHGVDQEFTKSLEIVGVGYRAQVKGNVLDLSLGFSHSVELEIPKGLTVECPKNTQIVIKGVDKQLVGEFAANVRKLRKPEPYKGKGIRYEGEVVRRKAGKTAK